MKWFSGVFWFFISVLLIISILVAIKSYNELGIIDGKSILGVIGSIIAMIGFYWSSKAKPTE